MMIKNKSWASWIVFWVLSLLTLNVWAAPNIEHWKTEEGLRVYYVAAPDLPMLDLRLVFDAGVVRDGERGGLASLTNSVLDQGADGLTADQLADAFESVGARVRNGVNLDTAWLSLRTLTLEPQFTQALTTWLKVLNKPDFPAKDFKNIQKLMLVDLDTEQQSPEAQIGKAFAKAVYGTHPYANQQNGNADSLNALTLSDIKAFHKQYYVAQNAVLAIVGAVDRAKAETLAKQVSHALGQGQAAAALPAVPALTEAKTLKLEFPSGQAHLLVGQQGNKRGDPDYFVMYLGNHILGGGGFTSRLTKEVRNARGLSYSVYSYFMPLAQLGTFQVALQTKREQIDEALKVVRETLQRFQVEGPTEAELVAAKKDITGGFPLRTASNSSIVEYLSVIGFYNLPLDYLDTFTDQVNAVTREQIIEVFKRRLQLDKMVTVILGTNVNDSSAEKSALDSTTPTTPEATPSTQPTAPRDETRPAS